jgi:hypothetical protein
MVDRIACPVVVPSDGLRFGEFSNAFRVLFDASGEAVLDFCVYSASDNVAKVVARVRVSPSFIPLLDSRIGEALAELEAARTETVVADPGAGVLVFPDGTRLMLCPDSGDTH